MKLFAHQLEVDFKAITSMTKLLRVRKYALNLVRSSKVKDYEKLWDYVEELKSKNPGFFIFIGCDHLIFQKLMLARRVF